MPAPGSWSTWWIPCSTSKVNGTTFNRVLRAVKNRFGPTHEIGVFEMQSAGLMEVENPSQLFLAERPSQASGSVVVASLEGTRPLLVETAGPGLPEHFRANPRRVAKRPWITSGSCFCWRSWKSALDSPCKRNDVYVNVVGGLSLNEPAIDLGVVVAVASSLQDAVIDADLVVLGEIGLTGEGACRGARGSPLAGSGQTRLSPLPDPTDERPGRFNGGWN